MSVYSCIDQGGVSTLRCVDHTAVEGQEGYSRHEKHSTE